MTEATERIDAWKTLEERWAQLSFDGLAQDEREAIALYWLQAELANGGMHQYFFNSSGDDAPVAVLALRSLGVHASLRLLEDGMAKLGPVYPVDRDKRRELINELGWDEDPFEAETTQLRNLSEDFFGLAMDRLTARYEAP